MVWDGDEGNGDPEPDPPALYLCCVLEELAKLVWEREAERGRGQLGARKFGGKETAVEALRATRQAGGKEEGIT